MKIILKGNPLSTQTIYGLSCKGNFPKRFMTQKGIALKEEYQWSAKTQWKKDIIYGSAEIDVKLYFGDKRKRDIDNHSKILLDSLTGIVWADDNQIQKMTIEKCFDKENPRIEINAEKCHLTK